MLVHKTRSMTRSPTEARKEATEAAGAVHAMRENVMATSSAIAAVGAKKTASVALAATKTVGRRCAISAKVWMLLRLRRICDHHPPTSWAPIATYLPEFSPSRHTLPSTGIYPRLNHRVQSTKKHASKKTKTQASRRAHAHIAACTPASLT
ncbi:hypothetical protein BU16DRAFT_603031 [Lophium mytilinum]|uniref:Uncharacterized protein n=1 Tax=Lophium mytilinum TaxID=390894 RepID=A0A6A6R6D7_9PEZI|nr:hypothetical protein BU16DRAFT_603031 [Lophium mytilinum]